MFSHNPGAEQHRGGHDQVGRRSGVMMARPRRRDWRATRTRVTASLAAGGRLVGFWGSVTREVRPGGAGSLLGRERRARRSESGAVEHVLGVAGPSGPQAHGLVGKVQGSGVRHSGRCTTHCVPLQRHWVHEDAASATPGTALCGGCDAVDLNEAPCPSEHHCVAP